MDVRSTLTTTGGDLPAAATGTGAAGRGPEGEGEAVRIQDPEVEVEVVPIQEVGLPVMARVGPAAEAAVGAEVAAL